MCCGPNIFINTPRIGGCCGTSMMNYVGFNNFSPGCFGYGFGCNSPANYALMGAGIGLGMAAGMALPGVFKGVWSGVKWAWNKAVVPASKWVFDNALKPAWNGIVKAVNWIGGGIKHVWNKIFKKGD